MYYSETYGETIDSATMKRKNLNRAIRGIFIRMPNHPVGFRSYQASELFKQRCKELDETTIQFIINSPKANNIVLEHMMDCGILTAAHVVAIIHSGLPNDKLLAYIEKSSNPGYTEVFYAERWYIRENYFNMLSDDYAWRDWLLNTFQPEAFQTYQTNDKFSLNLARNNNCPMNILLNLVNVPEVAHDLSYDLATIIKKRNLKITEPMSIIPTEENKLKREAANAAKGKV